MFCQSRLTSKLCTFFKFVFYSYVLLSTTCVTYLLIFPGQESPFQSISRPIARRIGKHDRPSRPVYSGIVPRHPTSLEHEGHVFFPPHPLFASLDSSSPLANLTHLLGGSLPLSALLSRAFPDHIAGLYRSPPDPPPRVDPPPQPLIGPLPRDASDTPTVASNEQPKENKRSRKGGRKIIPFYYMSKYSEELFDKKRKEGEKRDARPRSSQSTKPPSRMGRLENLGRLARLDFTFTSPHDIDDEEKFQRWSVPADLPSIPEEEDLGITTLVTPNRFFVLADLADSWRAPISVAVNIPCGLTSGTEGDATSSEANRRLLLDELKLDIGVAVDKECTDTLGTLHEIYTHKLFMSTWVDVHLILTFFPSSLSPPTPTPAVPLRVPPGHPVINPAKARLLASRISVTDVPREFNLWRNIARYFAPTAYILMLDVDFVPCTDLRTRILDVLKEKDGPGANLREGRAALVVPAFEYLSQKQGSDPSRFPSNKKNLLALVRNGTVAMFHRSWAPGHGATDYARYYAAKPGDVYLVPRTKYTHAYEPYVVFKREGAPWCDERFVGYGGNKAACLYEMYLWGMNFYVLSDDFLIHRAHPYEEKARAEERRMNRVVYNEFREEVCLKYIHYMAVNKALAAPQAANVLTECKKLKAVAGKIAEVLAGELATLNE